MKASEAVTDTCLVDLAARHGLRLATLDTGIKHPAVDLARGAPASYPSFLLERLTAWLV